MNAFTKATTSGVLLLFHAFQSAGIQARLEAATQRFIIQKIVAKKTNGLQQVDARVYCFSYRERFVPMRKNFDALFLSRTWFHRMTPKTSYCDPCCNPRIRSKHTVPCHPSLVLFRCFPNFSMIPILIVINTIQSIIPTCIFQTPKILVWKRFNGRMLFLSLKDKISTARQRVATLSN